MTDIRHWTERSIEDFAYSVASDFIDLLREEMDTLGWSKSRLAKAAKVSKGRITQIFANPGNIEMMTMVKIAKALRMKVAAFPYRDLADPNNDRGPINSEVFRLCWEKAERPSDMWEFEAKSQTTTIDRRFVVYQEMKGRHGEWMPASNAGTYQGFMDKDAIARSLRGVGQDRSTFNIGR